MSSFACAVVCFFSPRRVKEWQRKGSPEKERRESLQRFVRGMVWGFGLVTGIARRSGLFIQVKVCSSSEGPNPNPGKAGGKACTDALFLGSGPWWEKSGVMLWYRAGLKWKGSVRKALTPVFNCKLGVNYHELSHAWVFMRLPWTKSKVIFVFMWYQQHAHRFSNSLWFCPRWEVAGAVVWIYLVRGALSAAQSGRINLLFEMSTFSMSV